MAAAAFAVVLGCGGAGRSAPTTHDAVGQLAGRPTGPSNVTRADYAGSSACTPCHADVVRAWQRSPMHRMTRDLPGAEVRAPFNGARFRFKGDLATFETRGADRFVRIEPAGAPARTYRVTRVIGGRTREDFTGVDAASGGEEVVLPVSYVFATQSFRYKGYSVMVHERDGLHAGPVWRETCIFCHNTVPELDRLVGAIAGPHAAPYQGEQFDSWLDPGARARVIVRDPSSFERAAASEVERIGALDVRWDGEPPARVARQAIASLRAGFDARGLVEVGVGCEACHQGARAHAADPAKPVSFSPTASWLAIDVPNDSPAMRVNRTCARCHQVLFSRYPFTWEGGRRDAEAGGSHINSGEGRDFLLGSCARAMACTACHDPHGGDDAEARRVLATPAGNRACVGCHAAYADPSRLRAHAHHDPGGAGGSCVACHMPRKNMGLEGVLTRYHRIGSPTDPARVLGDRPLECALCHVDRSVRSLVDAMEAWWPVRYPRQRLEELYGSLDANVVRATLERGKAHERAVAIGLLGEAKADDAVPALGRELLDEYPLIREWAKRALVSIRGACDVDLMADDAAIAAAGRRCTAQPLSAPVRASAAGADEDPED